MIRSIFSLFKIASRAPFTTQSTKEAWI